MTDICCGSVQSQCGWTWRTGTQATHHFWFRHLFAISSGRSLELQTVLRSQTHERVDILAFAVQQISSLSLRRFFVTMHCMPADSARTTPSVAIYVRWQSSV